MRHDLINPRSPHDIALICEDGRTLRYSALLAELDRIGHWFESRQLVFIFGRNDLASLLVYLAALGRDAVPLMLNGDAKAEHMPGLIEAFSPQFVFTGSFDADCRAWEPVAEEGECRLYRNPASTNPTLHPELAFLSATSGSTGSPKLVRLSMANLRANAAAIADYLEITPDDRAVTSLPISYSYGLSVVNSHLFAGASLVLTDRSLMDTAFWELARSHAVTSFAGVPYHYEMLLRLGLDQLNVPAIRKMTQAGGRLDPDKMHKVVEACAAQGIRFWTMYGQTEASPRISYVPPEETLNKLGSIGRAIPGGRMWVCNEAGEDITACHTVGELVYEGPNVCLGYAENGCHLARDDENRGILHTGDLARCDEDGYFFIEGRLSRFLKIYGTRISLDRIEKAVAERGFDCVAHGQDDRLIVSAVEAEDLEPVALRREVAAFAGVNAAAVTVSVFPEIPRLPSGKVDYPCLTRHIDRM